MGSNWYAKDGLSSFDEVVAKYEQTKPIRGGRASQDLRPLAERRYWWARVIKMSDNKYALCDGHWVWSNIKDEKIIEQTCPILWERKEDGDYMTVRSHMNGGMSVSRYAFLDRWLPKGMRFDWLQNGMHYVKYTTEKSHHEYYLPKFKGEFDWNARTFTMVEDNKLVFKHINDAFERVGDPVPLQTRRVDKELDVIYKPKMKEMWDWMCVVMPVMGDGLGDAKQEYASQITEGKASYWYWTRYADKNLIREVLADPEHKHRMALAGLLAYEAEAISNGRFEPAKHSFAKFRQTLRKVAGLYAVEMQ
jgi:hypothetical protein